MPPEGECKYTNITIREGGPQTPRREPQRADQAPHHLGAWTPRRTPALAAGGMARGAQEILPAPHQGLAKKRYLPREIGSGEKLGASDDAAKWC